MACMNLSTQVTADDVREFFYRADDFTDPAEEAHEMAGELSINGRSLVISMAIFGVAAIWLVWQKGLDGILSNYLLLGLVLLGLGFVPLGILWLWATGRLRETLIESAANREIDETSLCEGINIGSTKFDLDEDGLRVTMAEVQDTYIWRAFQGLTETPNTFCLMIDDGSAVVVPKRACGDETAQQAFRDFVTSKIEAP